MGIRIAWTPPKAAALGGAIALGSHVTTHNGQARSPENPDDALSRAGSAVALTAVGLFVSAFVTSMAADIAYGGSGHAVGQLVGAAAGLAVAQGVNLLMINGIGTGAQTASARAKVEELRSERTTLEQRIATATAERDRALGKLTAEDRTTEAPSIEQDPDGVRARALDATMVTLPDGTRRPAGVDRVEIANLSTHDAASRLEQAYDRDGNGAVWEDEAFRYVNGRAWTVSHSPLLTDGDSLDGYDLAEVLQRFDTDPSGTKDFVDPSEAEAFHRSAYGERHVEAGPVPAGDGE